MKILESMKCFFDKIKYIVFRISGGKMENNVLFDQMLNHYDKSDYNEDSISYTKELRLNKLAILIDFIMNNKYGSSFFASDCYEAWKDGIVGVDFWKYYRDVEKNEIKVVKNGEIDKNLENTLKILDPFFSKLSGDTLVAFIHQLNDSWESPFCENYQDGNDRTKISRDKVINELSNLLSDFEDENEMYEYYESIFYPLERVKYYDYSNGKKEVVEGKQLITIFFPKTENRDEIKKYLESLNLNNLISSTYDYDDYIYYVEKVDENNYVLEH